MRKITIVILTLMLFNTNVFATNCLDQISHDDLQLLWKLLEINKDKAMEVSKSLFHRYKNCINWWRFFITI